MANGIMLGGIEIGNLKFGTEQVDCVYLGADMIWCKALPPIEYVQVIEDPWRNSLDMDFGYTVAMYEDTMVVLNMNSREYWTLGYGYGFIEIWNKVSGVWTFTQRILNEASGETVAEYYGYNHAVKIHKDTIIVGINDASNMSAQPQHGNYGSILVYVFTGSTWVLQQEILNPYPYEEDHFGTTVMLYDDTIITHKITNSVGATPYPHSTYSYIRNGNTWVMEQEFDFYNCSNVIFGDKTAGSTYEHHPDGALITYVRENGVWAEEQVIPKASSAVSNDESHWIVETINKETIAITTRAQYTARHGKVYIYTFGTTWNLTQILDLDRPVDYANDYADRVSIQDNVMCLRHYGSSDNARGFPSVETYTRSRFGQQFHLVDFIPNPEEYNDSFGLPVIVSGNNLLASNYGWYGGGTDADKIMGRILFYELEGINDLPVVYENTPVTYNTDEIEYVIY